MLADHHRTTTPRDYATDVGYASMDKAGHTKKKGVVNIVFNKVVGSLRNQTSSPNMETRLKKWRSGIEANISNPKRGFSLSHCNWKGWVHYRAKVLWSIIGRADRLQKEAASGLRKPTGQPMAERDKKSRGGACPTRTKIKEWTGKEHRPKDVDSKFWEKNQ